MFINAKYWVNLSSVLLKKSLKEYGEDKKEIRDRLNKKKQENPLKYFTEGI
ncbi:hypothetical protein KJ980_07520 [Patescibacteria group bacterium]|nr:hypothetical protein [Patescibacteria group bacterium]MBU4016571.1 hypothetical protein [Patescibacteria group bacterium]MBU4099470.1 hypothetical protein [Patescibacteria group bacterium]